jgi:hypothetical protein
MPVKIARSAARPSFGLLELLAAIHTSRQSCSKAGKARIFALVWESSAESRLISSVDHCFFRRESGVSQGLCTHLERDCAFEKNRRLK